VTWAPDYCTSSELKSYLRIDDDADDVFIALWITAASRNVDDFCGRQFGTVDEAEDRTYSAHYDKHIGAWVVQADDLYGDDITVVGPNAETITDFEFGPANAVRKGKVYERVLLTQPGPSAPFGNWWGWPYAQATHRPQVKVTITSSQWGWDPASAGPKVAKVGMLLQAARLAARRDSPFGVAGSPSDGSELRLLAQLDPDFKTSLKPFQRAWWAA
jgi:hypothetical protein